MKSAKALAQLAQFTAILGILVLPVFVLAQGMSQPHQFFGSVNYTNGAAPNGFSVEAKIKNGPVVGSSVTSDGNYGYNPNLLFALDNNGVNAGKTVEFFVNGIKANETAIFANGASTQKNLTIPASLPTTSTSSSTPTPSGSTGGGGGGTPPPAPKTGDINSDSKVDKYDFAMLMAAWGQTGSNSSDLNHDNKVDKYDFALLMLNWGK